MGTVTIDILHECLIQKILCFLSFKDATKMSILSKTWLQAWLTHPNLDFRIPCDGVNSELVDTIMERYKDGNIHIHKFELSHTIVSQVVLPIDKWLDIALHNGVNDLVLRIFTSSLPIQKILAAKSLRELVLWGCNLKSVSFTSGVANCKSLRKLSLSYVSLNETILQTLLNSCSSIVDFILEDCRGLGKIELLNLPKIKSVSIKSRRKQLVKIQTPTLEHLRYCGCISQQFDISECQNLKSLDITRVTIVNGSLQTLISRSQSLKVLKIQYCGGVGEIDYSNLVSLEYIGFRVPELKIGSESSQLKHSKMVLTSYNNLDAEWFCKLRKFLSNSISWSQVTIEIDQCNEVNIKDMQLHHGIAIPRVDVLNVEIVWQNWECPTFVDALLLTCQPRRLNISSFGAMNKCFIDCLMYKKNSINSTCQRSKPWHSQLKEVKVFNEKNQPLELTSEELTIQNLMKMGGFYFLLDWKCN